MTHQYSPVHHNDVTAAASRRLYRSLSSHHESRPCRLTVGRCFIWMLLALVWVGCKRQNEPGSQPADATAAAARLAELIDKYQTTTHYHDRGVLRLRFQSDGKATEEETEIFVDFARPNQLRLNIARGINRLVITSDGTKLHTIVEDPVTDNLRNQVVQHPSPPQLTVREVYDSTELLDPANPNTMLSVLMGMPLDLRVSQLGLLLPGSAFLNLLNASTNVTPLAPELIDGQTCHGIQLEESAGRYIFWIDDATGIVRRIEYPTHGLFESVAVDQRPRDVRLTLDLHEASFDSPDVETEFVSPSAEHREVQYFVLPPVPLPSERFGRVVGAMAFADLGDDAARTTVDGAIQVLIWWDKHAPSEFTLTRLENMYRRFAKEGDRVAFRAICVHPSDEFDAASVEKLAATWESTIPRVRDVDAAGRDVLNITEAPTVVVLDSKRRLHLFEVGVNPQIDQSIQVVLRRLLAGEDVASDLLKNSQLAEDRFQHQLRLASIDRNQGTTAVPQLTEATDFRKIQSSVAWRCDSIDAPGNLLLIPAPNAKPRLLVLSKMRDVVELDLQGNTISKKALDLDPAAFVSQLRIAQGASGAGPFVGFSPLGRHLFLFDSQYQRILRYPDASQRHNGIMDVAILDLDDDGQQELYVGFADPHGCHRVDFDGRRIWSNRNLPATLSLARRSLEGLHHLLATGEQGWILPISAHGVDGQPVTVGQRTIHQIVATESAKARPTQFLGMSYSIEGRLIALGLDQQLQEMWSYGLPSGTYRYQVQSPIWARLFEPDSGYWLLAGPDGSVHIIQDDGTFFDFAALGQDIIGLAGHGMGETGRLYVATDGSITAYDLRRPQTP